MQMSQKKMCSETTEIITKNSKNVRVSEDVNKATGDVIINIKWNYHNKFDAAVDAAVDGFILKVTVADGLQESTVVCCLLALPANQRNITDFEFNCLKLESTSKVDVTVDITPFPVSVWETWPPFCVNILTMRAVLARPKRGLCDKFSKTIISYEVNNDGNIPVSLMGYVPYENYMLTLQNDDGNGTSSSMNVRCSDAQCYHVFKAIPKASYYIKVKPNCDFCYYCTVIRTLSFYVPPITGTQPSPSMAVKESEEISSDIVIAALLALLILLLTTGYVWYRCRCRSRSQRAGSRSMSCPRVEQPGEMSLSMLNNVHPQVPTLSKDVCLIYSEDHDHHISVVKKLASYLESTFGSKVQLASVNAMEFYPEQFSNALNIIINSSSLGIMFADFANNSDMNYINNFTVLREIEKNNVISIYFDHTEESRIPHDLFMKYRFHYKLMENYSQFHSCLQENLHLKNSTINMEQQEHLLQLNKEVSIAKEFQERTHNWTPASSCLLSSEPSLDGQSDCHFIAPENCSLCHQSITESENMTRQNERNCCIFKISLQNQEVLEYQSLGGTDV